MYADGTPYVPTEYRYGKATENIYSDGTIYTNKEVIHMSYTLIHTGGAALGKAAAPKGVPSCK